MINKLHFSIAALFLVSAPTVLLAQDYDYHPYISDSFSVSLGAMRSSNSFNIGAYGSEEDGEDIDFGDSVGVSDTSTFFNGQFKWKFGSEKKWSVAGQYFGNNAKGNATLTEDVEWEDVTFEQGTYVEAGINFKVARVFAGRSFVRNDQHDFGVGLGLHNLDLSVYIEGEVKANGESSGVQKREVGASAPLPNIGAWYNFSPARNWLLHGRVDWISANIGDYDGSFWNASVGVNYQVWRNVGLDLSWQYFNLNVNVGKSDWSGGAEMTYSGPVLGATFSW
jgi:hypothetical protein